MPFFQILYICGNSPLRLCFPHTHSAVLSQYSCPQAPRAAPLLSQHCLDLLPARQESPAPLSPPGTARGTLYPRAPRSIPAWLPPTCLPFSCPHPVVPELFLKKSVASKPSSPWLPWEDLVTEEAEPSGGPVRTAAGSGPRGSSRTSLTDVWSPAPLLRSWS